jgi:hypothetical protein
VSDPKPPNPTADHDLKVAEEIATTRAELDAAREVVRTLANDLADVADVIEPVLQSHVKRLREVRMTTMAELREITAGVRELKTVMTSKDTEQMLTQAERFLRVCREIEEFRASGFLDDWVQLLAPRAGAR